MNETSPQQGSSGGNKGIVLLLAGGAILLVVAGLVYFLRQASPTPPPPKPPVIEEPDEAPAPLVIPAKSKPLALQSNGEDAGVVIEVEAPEDKRTAQRKGSSEKKGTIDPKMVNKFINKNFNQVRNCYERRLKKNPMLEGKVDLNIKVASSGKVTSIGVNKDTVGDGPMLECVKRTIRGWQFPKPTGGRVVIGKSFKFKKKI